MQKSRVQFSAICHAASVREITLPSKGPSCISRLLNVHVLKDDLSFEQDQRVTKYNWVLAFGHAGLRKV